ncbi:MAG: deoxyhypusine synthase family protein [Nitrososphaerota archaeon]|nr:deoxyhypusine synthase family protein [Aigarchaeota archaeon]MDW8076306.1 deoxyhypusine synthase family protein [Nitrososphaerota archaeon]
MNGQQYLREPIKSIKLDENTNLVGLVEQFRYTSYQSRNLYNAFHVMELMQTDPDRPIVFLTLAGAMIPAGIKGVLNEMMKRKMVDVIISTGANVTHDVVESLGFPHYKGSPYADDEELRKAGICRIYDTFLQEDGFWKEQEIVFKVAEIIGDKTCSSREFLYELGRELRNHESFVSLAAELGVPIFCPALNDSDIGIALTKYYEQKRGKDMFKIDPIRDNYEIFQIFAKAKKTGIIIIGGGVPRNYGQQIPVIAEVLLKKPARINMGLGHDYGILITTDDPKWGGLSGSTFSEAISWGKYSTEARKAEVYCDATIAFPLIVGAVIQKIGKQLDTKPRCRFIWEGDTLRDVVFEK